MPDINWSLDVGDIVIAFVALVFIPVTRILIGTMSSVRMAVEELTVAVFGTEKDRTIGIVSHLAELRKEHNKHRNWLIEIQADRGIKRDDRT